MMIRIEQLLGKKVRDVDGQVVGHIEELGVTWTNEGALVTEVRLGPAALVERLSAVFRSPPESLRIPWTQIDLSNPKHPRLRVPKDQIEKL